MPSITLSHTGSGPIATVVVMVSLPRQAALQAANNAVPTPVTGTFLIDTGASHSVVDAALIAPLGLAPTGQVMCHTPSTGTTAQAFNQFDVALFVPGVQVGQGWLIPAIPVMESQLAAQGIQGLLGRDVLDRAVLIYNGPSSTFTLAY